LLLYIVVEDELSEVILKKMLGEYFVGTDLHVVSIGKRGKGYIKNRINDFNNRNNDLPFFILVDLDLSSCAPELLHQWLNRPCRNNLIVRVAVREVEAWLLADTNGFSNYLNMDHSYISKEVNDPDNLLDPKFRLLSLVEQSRKRNIIGDIVKKEGSSLKQGPGYNTRLTEFVLNNWNMERARSNSDSFNRAINALQNLTCKKSVNKMMSARPADDD